MTPAFRNATHDDVNMILDWAASESWNPGLEDAEPFLAADPNGFFVASVAGHPVAAISVVNHDPATTFLGLYLCKPEWRARGIGFALWQHALEHAGSRSVLLDGVAAQQDNYAKSGFQRVGATLRWQGNLPANTANSARPSRDTDIARIMALDQAANGYARQAFLAAWVRPTATRRTVIASDGSGFATARLCQSGCKIGPVVAQDARSALHLAISAAQQIGQTCAMIDIPAQNDEFTKLIKAQGFATSFSTARMVRGVSPTMSRDMQAVATLELS